MPRASTKYPVSSYRIRPEAHQLVKVWASQRNLTAAQFLEYLLTKFNPPTAAGEAEAQVRQAHVALRAAMSRTGDL